MDNHETFGPIQPARAALPSPMSPAPRPVVVEAHASAFNVRVVARAVARHWWQILMLWVVVTAAAVVVIQTQVVPKYRVNGVLRVLPVNDRLFGDTQGSEALDLYMGTQCRLLTTAKILNVTLADPKVSALERVRTADDPEVDLANNISASVMPGTSLIAVGMTSKDPTEAAIIINTVIDKYLDSSLEFASEATRSSIDKLDKYKTELEAEKLRIAARVKELISKGNVDAVMLDRDRDTEKEVNDGGDAKSSRKVTVAEYENRRQMILDTEMKIINAETVLQTLEAEAVAEAAVAKGKGQDQAKTALTWMQKTVAAKLSNDQELKGITLEINKLEGQIERNHGISRLGNDPHTAALQSRIAGLKQSYVKTLALRRAQIRAEIEANPGSMDPAGKDPDRLVREAKKAVDLLKANREKYQENLRALEVASRETATDRFDVSMYTSDLGSYKNMIDRVEQRLQQLKYDAKADAKVTLWSRASVPKVAASDYRKRLLLATPAGVLAALVGVFMLLEIRAGRIASAEELTARSKVEVLGVLPPLPGPRPSPGPRAAREHGERVEEFVQSLDHLRVTLCGAPTGDGGRIVLITSAVGGEGKTTLAVQLAARCANAGVSTLLIDADLRRAALGRLLDVGEGAPGLSDVLRGDVELENALVVVGQAGGFHLMPAGSPGHDPSRVLQGKGLGHLLATLRTSFDIIIIDTPPVLPVPDALTLGRWADGAVLAVRRDNSRFPLVEQANRRLVTAGIPVLGAVINGLRPTMSAYGSYAYSGRGSSQSYEADQPIPT